MNAHLDAGLRPASTSVAVKARHAVPLPKTERRRC
jgi:hypothetical protein